MHESLSQWHVNVTLVPQQHMSHYTSKQLAKTFCHLFSQLLTQHTKSDNSIHHAYSPRRAPFDVLGVPTGVTTPSNPVGLPAAAREAG